MRYYMRPQGIAFFLLSALLAVGPGAARAADEAAPAEGRPFPVRVGIATIYPPLAFTKDGEVAGLEVELARAVGEALGKPVAFVQLEFGDLIPALEREQVDVVMSGMSITEERAARVDFIEPYMRVGQMALVRAADFSRFASGEALDSSSTKVGFAASTTAEKYVRSKLKKAQAKPYRGAEEGVAALRTGEVDVFIHDAPTIWAVSLSPNERELLALYTPLTEEYLAWAVRKHDPVLKAALDAIVRRWKAEGKIDAAIARWIPVRVELKDRAGS